MNLVVVELLDGAKMALALLEAKDDIADVILNSLKDALELEVILIFELALKKQNAEVES